MDVLLVMTGCRLFHILMVLGKKDVLNTCCVRAYSKMGRIVMCKLGVWFCVGMCECVCGGKLKLCFLSVQSC